MTTTKKGPGTAQPAATRAPDRATTGINPSKKTAEASSSATTKASLSQADTPASSSSSTPAREATPGTQTTPTPYPNTWYDPDPLPATATEARKKQYTKDANTLGSDTLDALKEMNLRGEDLWEEFISVFRPHTIKLWNSILLARWINAFKAGDVYIEHGRGADKAQKLIDLLYRPQHIGRLGPDVVPASTSPPPRPHRNKLRRRSTSTPKATEPPHPNRHADSHSPTPTVCHSLKLPRRHHRRQHAPKTRGPSTRVKLRTRRRRRQ